MDWVADQKRRQGPVLCVNNIERCAGCDHHIFRFIPSLGTSPMRRLREDSSALIGMNLSAHESSCSRRVFEWQLVSNMNQTRIQASFHSIGGRYAPQISFFVRDASILDTQSASQPIISTIILLHNPFWHDIMIDDSSTKGSESKPASRALQNK